MDEKGLPERIGFETGDEIELRGTTICPGIRVGRVRVLDREVVIPKNKIAAGQVQSEQQR